MDDDQGIIDKHALYKLMKRVGLDAKAHLISLYPIPLRPGAELLDVREREDRTSLSGISSRGRVSLRGGSSSWVISTMGCGWSKKRALKARLISLWLSDRRLELHNSGGMVFARRPLRQLQTLQRPDMLSAPSKSPWVQLCFARETVTCRACSAVCRSGPCEVRTMVSAAEHSLFHHFTPRGSGAVFLLKTDALALSMSLCKAVAAASRDVMSVTWGVGNFENSLLHESLNSSTIENPTISVSSGVGRVCDGIQDVVMMAISMLLSSVQLLYCILKSFARSF